MVHHSHGVTASGRSDWRSSALVIPHVAITVAFLGSQAQVGSHLGSMV